MKNSKELSPPHILLFWSLPSITMVKAYQLKSYKLDQAVSNSKSVEVLTLKNKVLKLERVDLEAGKYFGFETIKGNIKKIFLNINNIKTITLL
jgi:hypothetical protein